MTDQPTLHTCARCNAAVQELVLLKEMYAAIQRQSARRMELLLECHVALYDQAPEGGNCDALLARIEAEK